MNKSINSFFQFNEDTKVCEVSNCCCMFASNRIFLCYVLPWVWNKLFNTHRHFSFFSVKRQDYCLNFVSNFQEVVSCSEVLTPRHLCNVNQTFNTRDNFNESAIVSNNNNLTFYLVTN